MRDTKKALSHCPWGKALKIVGAEEESRTPTSIQILDPEPSASTNSATSATGMNMILEG